MCTLDPDVSSPTVRFYPPDTDLQLVSQQNGWMKVADPGTDEIGWIFQVYLSSSEGPSADASDAKSPSAGVQSEGGAKALVLSDEPTPLVSKRKASKRWSSAKEKRRFLGRRDAIKALPECTCFAAISDENLAGSLHCDYSTSVDVFGLNSETTAPPELR